MSDEDGSDDNVRKGIQFFSLLTRRFCFFACLCWGPVTGAPRFLVGVWQRPWRAVFTTLSEKKCVCYVRVHYHSCVLCGRCSILFGVGVSVFCEPLPAANFIRRLGLGGSVPKVGCSRGGDRGTMERVNNHVHECVFLTSARHSQTVVFWPINGCLRLSW